MQDLKEDVMSDTGITSGTQAAPATTRRRALNFALWALQVFWRSCSRWPGLAKVVGDPAMVEMFATIGVGQWFRYAVGALEIAGAVGVLVPRLSGSGRARTCLPDGGRDPHQPVRPRREPAAPVSPAGGERFGRLGTAGVDQGPP